MTPPLRVLCVGHALKESLTAGQSLAALRAGVLAAGGVVSGHLAISDGGDGLLDAWSAAHPTAAWRHSHTTGPLGHPVAAPWLLDPAADTHRAILESATAVGLALIPPASRSILDSGTAGLGDLFADAIAAGATEIVVGIGGSATCDGGLGMLARIARRLLAGKEGPPPTNFAPLAARALDTPLANQAASAIPHIRAALAPVAIRVLCDVDTPLLGPTGTAPTFAPQKGASPEEVEVLDQLLAPWAAMVESAASMPGLSGEPGSGAAGGLGFALRALGARLFPGADCLLDTLAYDQTLGGCDAVVTSEGRFDATSFGGKAPWRAATRAAAAGLRATILCGSAHSEAAAQAERQGVRIIPFGETIPPDRRACDSPAAMSAAVQRFVEECRPNLQGW